MLTVMFMSTAVASGGITMFMLIMWRAHPKRCNDVFYTVHSWSGTLCRWQNAKSSGPPDFVSQIHVPIMSVKT